MDSSLEQFIHSVSGDQYFRVEDDLGNGFVRLRAAEAQRRQALQDIRSFEDVILELLRNSRDAHARAIFLATWTEGSKRFATILDNGDGIPLSMHQTVFEPFVTSKPVSYTHLYHVRNIVGFHDYCSDPYRSINVRLLY